MTEQGGSSITGRTLGPYTIRQRIGAGGMGEVYLAHDAALDRLVAVKTLIGECKRDPALVKRFQREAQAAARLNHPNIVQVYGVDITSDPPYMAMEFINGSSMEQRIGSGNPIPWDQALMVAQQVAVALSAAHARDIVHRDIKPGNIMIDRGGRVRVTDFGIAKVLGSGTQLTGERMTIGSPNYMSPEQCAGGTVGPQSDLFSLGSTLFEMITGQLPFEAEESVAIIKKVAMDPLPRLDLIVPGVPDTVQALVEGLTAKDVGHRYATASQVAEDIALIRAGQPFKHLPAHRHFPAVVKAAGLPAAARDSAVLVIDDLVSSPVAKYPKYEPTDESGFPWAWIAGGVAALLVVLAVVAAVAGRVRTPEGAMPAVSAEVPSAPSAAPNEPPPPAGLRPPPRDGRHPPPPPGTPPPFRPGGPPPPGGFPPGVHPGPPPRVN